MMATWTRMATVTMALACAACPTRVDDLCADGACTSPDGGNADAAVPVGDGGKDAAPVPPDCDPAADAKDAPGCAVDSFAVFVDATGGADESAGTKAAPKKTLAGALAALGNRSRIYVCGSGTFAESVKLTGTSAASIFGGFACAAWTHDGSRAKLAPSADGPALHVDEAGDPIVVSDLDVVAKDGAAPGASSVAVFVSRASKLTLRRASITAGKGQNGIDASGLADFSPASAPSGTGGSAGGAPTSNPACPTSVGGAAGKDGAVNGAPGQVALAPEYPAGNTGAGGTGGGNCAIGIGMDGSYGTAGPSGAGAATLGVLDASGWKGSDGLAGGGGGNGQGGGGGAQRLAGGVGGSGGPGGCGGAGGGKGTAGGSSIAVLAFESTLVIEASTLTASAAGRGGNGAKGQKGQLPSTSAAAPNNGLNACAGGLGGIGGSGGGGGGGAGGVSAGVLYKGKAPTLDGNATSAIDTLASVTIGSAGAAGSKGDGGDAAQATAPVSRAGLDGTGGAPGQAKAVMSAP